MAYDNNMRAAIWPNRKKEKENQPDFKGEATIDGKEYWVNAWKKKSDAKDKSPSLSMTFQGKDEAHSAGIEAAKGAIDDDGTPPF